MLHHSADDLIVQQQMAIIDDLEYTSAKSAENKSEIVSRFQNTTEDQKEGNKIAIATTATTPTKNNNDEDDVIDLDSSPEKSNLKTLLSPKKDSNDKKISLDSNTLKENSLKMQPLEKVRETITKSNETSNIKSELKDQEEDRSEKCTESDQNKENIENNENQNQINGKEDEFSNIDKENQLNQENNEKLIVSEKQLNKDDENNEKQQDETKLQNDESLELMDVSQNENNDKDDNKNTMKIDKKESSNYATNDIKINDNSKTPEPPTSTNTTKNQLNTLIPTRKRLRSRSINEDANETNNISNNIQLTSTSTPLANHKDPNKEFVNSTEQQNVATNAKTIPFLNANNASTNACNNNFDDDDNIEQLHPMKKLRAELETNFIKHDNILAEYIEKTTNETPDDIDKHISQLAIEIHTLNDMIKAKEYEWNNMLHLKKVKEEICFRLTRKKQVMELMATKLGEITNHIPNATTSIEQNLLGEKLSIAAQLKIPNLTNHHLLSSPSPPTTTTTTTTSATTPALSNPTLAAQAAVAAAAAAAAGSSSTAMASSSAAALAAMAAATSNLLNYSNAAATTISSSANKNNINNFLSNNNEFSLNPTSTSAAQNILQLRANMKSSDLAKEKSSAQKIHRNILPKPSSSATSTSTSTSSQQQQQQQQLQQHQQLLATSLIQNAAANSGGGGASASQLAGLSGLFGSATAPVVLSGGASGGGGAVQIPLPLSNVATGSLMSAHTPPGATQTPTATNQNAITSLNHQPTILNNYLTAAASVQQQLGELFNGHHNPGNAQNGQNLMVGRQGVFKDVKSIIADYRQRHPEQVPRRGRRMKSTNSNDVSLGASGQNRFSNSELNNLLNRLEAYSRGGTSSSHSPNTSQNSILNAVVAAGQQQQQQTSCAPTSTTTNYNSTFSPTLARLLTAPERITNNLSGSQNSTIGSHQTSTITAAQAAAAASSNPTGLNLTKVVAHNSEITITPVMNSSSGQQQSALQHSLLQKQLKDALNISKNLSSGSTSDRIKSEYFMNMDDEADDSVDRLVIDEGGGDTGNGEEIQRIAPNAIGQEFHENEVPWCQGCKNQEAQFVCAGCGSQWYCSRECQVQAWDEHSETCTG